MKAKAWVKFNFATHNNVKRMMQLANTRKFGIRFYLSQKTKVGHIQIR
jgi:hypothetical protein